MEAESPEKIRIKKIKIQFLKDWTSPETGTLFKAGDNYLVDPENDLGKHWQLEFRFHEDEMVPKSVVKEITEIIIREDP